MIILQKRYHLHCLEWDKLHFNTVWPKWKDGIEGKLAQEIENIGMCNEILSVTHDHLTQKIGVFGIIVIFAV